MLISLYTQAQDSMSLDPFVVYLATNYVDRFLSRETISVKIRTNFFRFLTSRFEIFVLRREINLG